MKIVLMRLAVAVACAFSIALAQQPKTTPATMPAELEYEAYCKKTPQEKRSLFRAATPAQKAAIARRQMERFRDANRARLSKAQLDLLGELTGAITPSLFAGDAKAQEQLESMSDRVETAFSSTDQDQMDRDGPCIPRRPLPVGA